MRCDTLTPVTAPEYGVRVCPLLGRHAAASALPSLANRCLQATGSGGRLSFWINGHTCPPTCRWQGWDEKKGRGRGLILGGRRPDYEWMDGSECLCRQTWLRLTDLRQAGWMQRGEIFHQHQLLKTNKHLKYQETEMAATLCEHYSKTKCPKPKK